VASVIIPILLLIVIEKDAIKLHWASRRVLMKLVQMQGLDRTVMVECANILAKTYVLLDLIIEEHHRGYLEYGLRFQPQLWWCTFFRYQLESFLRGLSEYDAVRRFLLC